MMRTSILSMLVVVAVPAAIRAQSAAPPPAAAPAGAPVSDGCKELDAFVAQQSTGFKAARGKVWDELRFDSTIKLPGASSCTITIANGADAAKVECVMSSSADRAVAEAEYAKLSRGVAKCLDPSKWKLTHKETNGVSVATFASERADIVVIRALTLFGPTRGQHVVSKIVKAKTK